jgi:hypothetical protein
MVNDVIRTVESSRVAKELARPARKAAARKAPANKAGAKKTAAKKAPARKRPAKSAAKETTG